MSLPPNILYKYTTAETTKIILENCSLRWSSPRLFNDVNEFFRTPNFSPTLEASLFEFKKIIVGIALGCKFQHYDKLKGKNKELIVFLKSLASTGLSEKQLIDILNTTPKNYSSKLRELLLAENILNIDTARVFCLTENPLSNAMWGHYANQHKGCVLGFKHLPVYDTPFIEAKKVTYSDEPLDLGSGLDFLLYGETQELLSKTMHAMLYNKDESWQFENEWRVITWRPNENSQFSDIKFIPEELESISLGVRIDPAIKESILKLASQNYPMCTIYEISNANGKLERNVYAG